MGDGIRVGVFGGTFDPPHVGHLMVAQQVAEEAGLDRILWIPAARPPHKHGGSLTPGPVRAEMVEAAIQGNPRFRLSAVELVRDGLSYTVDTLRHFARDRADWSLSLIMGGDQLADFHRWHEPEEIVTLAEILAVSREGVLEGRVTELPGARIRHVPVTRIDVSASLIRHRVAQGKSIRYMVPDSVLSIIEREKLYRG